MLKWKEKTECPICSKMMLKGSLKEHLKVHSEQKQHTCRFCDMQFRKASNRLLHETKIHGLAFKCHFCSKKFGHASHLLNHLKSHTENNFYICSTCGLVIKLSSKAKKMLKKSHSETCSTLHIDTKDSLKFCLSLLEDGQQHSAKEERYQQVDKPQDEPNPKAKKSKTSISMVKDLPHNESSVSTEEKPANIRKRRLSDGMSASFGTKKQQKKWYGTTVGDVYLSELELLRTVNRSRRESLVSKLAKNHSTSSDEVTVKNVSISAVSNYWPRVLLSKSLTNAILKAKNLG